MGRARKSAAEKEAQVAVKKDMAEKKLQETVRKEQSQTMRTLADGALEELNRKLAEKPMLAQHFKTLLAMGAFDAIDRAQPEDVNLLSKELLVGLIKLVNPKIGEWLESSQMPQGSVRQSPGVLDPRVSKVRPTVQDPGRVEDLVLGKVREVRVAPRRGDRLAGSINDLDR